MNGFTPTSQNNEQRFSGLRLLFGGRFRIRRAGEREAFILALICMADMFTTLYWVVFGYATEANYVLAWTFQAHPVTFVLIKSLSCIPAILLAPRLAQRHRTFTVWLLRLIIAAYVLTYFKFARF